MTSEQLAKINVESSEDLDALEEKIHAMNDAELLETERIVSEGKRDYDQYLGDVVHAEMISRNL
jgi:hypothetical protein